MSDSDYDFQLLTPHIKLMFSKASGALVGIQNPKASGADLLISNTGGGAWGGITGDLADQDDLQTALDVLTAAVAGKQATLVSGTSIKTINGLSLLGSGNLSLSGVGIDSSLTAAQILSAESGGTLTPGAMYRASDDATLWYYASAADAAHLVATEQNLAALLLAIGYAAGYDQATTAGIGGALNPAMLANIVAGHEYASPKYLHPSAPEITVTVPAGTFTGVTVSDNGSSFCRLTSGGAHGLTNATHPSGAIGRYVYILTSSGFATGLHKITAVPSGTTLDLETAFTATTISGMRLANSTVPIMYVPMPADYMAAVGDELHMSLGIEMTASTNAKTISIVEGTTETGGTLLGSGAQGRWGGARTGGDIVTDGAYNSASGVDYDITRNAVRTASNKLYAPKLNGNAAANNPTAVFTAVMNLSVQAQIATASEYVTLKRFRLALAAKA